VAGAGGDDGGGLFVLGFAGAVFGGARVESASGGGGADDSAAGVVQSGAPGYFADVDIYGEWTDHGGDGWVAGEFDPAHGEARRLADDAAAMRGGAVGDECAGVRAVVLEAGRRRTGEPGKSEEGYREEFVFVPANAGAVRSGGRVVAAFHGLFVFGV